MIPTAATEFGSPRSRPAGATVLLTDGKAGLPTPAEKRVTHADLKPHSGERRPPGPTGRGLDCHRRNFVT
jgi:hypothetical protein